MQLDLIMLIMTVVPLVFGLLLGLLRGSRRSILRIILVILCVVAAFFLKDVATEKILAVEVEGKTIPETIVSSLPEEMRSLGDDVVIPIVKTIINVVAFVVLFGVLQFLSWAILFPICKIFVKKGEKKHALIGGIVGAVQGVVVAFVICVIMNGLLVNVAKVNDVITSMSEISQTPETSSVATLDDGDTDGNPEEKPEGGIGGDMSFDMLVSYRESAISKFYSSVGGGAFDLVARTTVDDKTVTLSGQLDALVGVANMAKEMTAIQNVDFTNGIKGSAEDIRKIFDSLAEINNGLSPESKEAINTLVQGVAEGFDLPVDVSVVDFTKIDFAKEGQIITSLAEYGDINPATLTTDDAKKIVEKVVDSDLILPLLESNDDLDLKLPDEQKAEARKQIDKLQADGVSESKINSLKNIFGLVDETPTQN